MGKFGTSWPSTNPSSVPGSCPEKTNTKLQKLVEPHVASFDYMIDEGLDLAVQNIAPMAIDVGNGNKMTIWIESAQIGYPTSDASSNHAKALLPSECRQRGISYTAPLVVTLGRSFGGSAIEQLQRTVGNIPIMVKSKRCHLAGLSPPELVQKREEANEMGGYFICNGNERCVRLLQMPRRHQLMAVTRGAFSKRGDLYSNKGVFMRCVRRDQSAVTMTLHYLLDGNATLRLGIQKKEFMVPVGLLLKALYTLTDREVYDRVVRGDTENTYLSARMELILRESKRFSVYSRDEALAYLGKHFRAVLPFLDKDMSNLEVGNRFIDECVFVHIPKGEKGRAQKVELLCLMIRKLYAFAKGDIREDNPDSVMNHELLLPGHLYLMILKESLQAMLLSIRLQIERQIADPKNKVTLIDMTYLKKTWERTANIGHLMTYFLNTGNLRSSSGLDLMQVAGYTIVAEKLNYYRYFSHFRSVHRGQFFTTMKTTAVRKLLPDSWGFMCPVHTPDGSPCGLLNHLAVECQLVTSPPFTADTVIAEENKLARFLADLGMVPATGYSDGACFMPYNYLPITLNGKVLGGAPAEVCVLIEQALRYTKAVKDTSLRKERGVVASLEVCLILPVVGGPFPGLFLSADAARFIRPVKQLNTDLVEFIGPMEQVFMNIAVLPADVRPSTTHMELKPTNMLSLVASLTPFSEHNQSPRNMYQCQMAKQTMGTPAHSIVHRTDNKMYRIQSPQAPIVHNERLREYELDEYPLGTNAVVAVISYTGFDMEDAMILNKSSYERGFGHASVYKQIKVDIGSDNATTKSYFGNIKPGSNGEMISPSLDRDGFPHIGQKIQYGEPIACHINSTTGKETFVKHKETEPAIIDQINLLGNTGANADFTKASIKLRFVRNPIIGDKFSSRHGQKGVMSILWPQADMPFSESGMSPDVIINPHAFPSRMTIGMLVESMAAKAGALRGEYMDATPFQFNEQNRAIDTFGVLLKKAGYNYMGSEPLYSGLTGTVMHADIYMGVVYYQRLRHMVSDKSQVRATGPINALTRQPLKGRKKKGGIRFGEMERDSLLAHGCSFLLQDRLMNCSDKHIATVCTKCGSLLSTLNQRASVSAAGLSDIEVAMGARKLWICSTCQTGDACEAVAMPYVFRYLANELAAMNIKMTMTLKGV
ncbi:DNA-directed RNA polymerase I subunit RPA2 [Thraustotheca clavata]|uniref:DNA-directed RNA polymerase subunit beta n=1 Tax=Thraustotheca clavata TaxID=74557 RepID=A0A1V9Z7U5_9STRA|nr:DNA-directed RNA polymerase I subunit RPA2 [Thraustotheca clavata]